MQSIQATFHQGVFRPVEPVELPDGCKVELQIIAPIGPTPKLPQRDKTDDQTEKGAADTDNNGGTLQERLTQLATQIPLHEWDSLPIDISSRLDDYLYGNESE